jgi:DNA-binding CsgD family transcriptional regulator
MNYLPLEGTGLQHQYLQKLQTLQLIERHLPGVFVIHDLRTSSVVYMSERGLKYLNTTLSELQNLGPAYHEKYFNPEDSKDYVPKILGMLERNNNDEMVSYFQQVRTSEQDEWNWFSSCTKVFLRDENHHPLFTITTAIPIDPHHYFSSKVERLLEENNFLQKNKETFAALTKREIEILKRMALGQNSIDMAKELFISEATAKTHRRNIKKKINAETTYDVTRFAQAFNII